MTSWCSCFFKPLRWPSHLHSMECKFLHRQIVKVIMILHALVESFCTTAHVSRARLKEDSWSANQRLTTLRLKVKAQDCAARVHHLLRFPWGSRTMANVKVDQHLRGVRQTIPFKGKYWGSLDCFSNLGQIKTQNVSGFGSLQFEMGKSVPTKKCWGSTSFKFWIEFHWTNRFSSQIVPTCVVPRLPHHWKVVESHPRTQLKLKETWSSWSRLDVFFHSISRGLSLQKTPLRSRWTLDCDPSFTSTYQPR